MKYFDELKRTMEYLAEQPNTLFLGQAVSYPGTAMFNTLKDINPEKRKELPVAENMQMGLSLGMSLNGYIPISVFPRWNFLLLATDQIVNHLDKYKDLGYRPGVIVRTSVGSIRPLHPQHQHVGNFTHAFRSMTKNIDFYILEEPEDIFKSYQKAYYRALNGQPTVVVEYGDYYNEK